jgi:hypothetical protein
MQSNKHLVDHNYTKSNLDLRVLDIKEELLALEFQRKGCGCTSNCSKNSIIKNKIQNHRLNILELNNKQRDLIILGMISTGFNKINNIINCNHTFNGNKLCIKTFLYMNSISLFQYNNLLKHYNMHGIVDRIHGNMHSKNNNSVTFEMIENCASFIGNYASLRAISIPGDLSYFKLKNTKLLFSCSYTKKFIHTEYKKYCIKNNKSFVKLEYFYKLWKQLKPDISVAIPRTDVC